MTHRKVKKHTQGHSKRETEPGLSLNHYDYIPQEFKYSATEAQ